ncbi:MAG TPA: methyltransferase domain-containing protein [Noviherbaspirillum sp.]|uniref:tRNA (guanine(46)-N(7))-methyltransferase TrmB n=1 Tax=Noviherbaspirillum sp. TaxID=1926288 RepID=UPI002D3F6D78|nr:methyltransferase domain-containing protein [Noviherbaspirillum sp.]HYD95116.1 methyltransferase domain-containing protein [Noviherbaspirillum sp.]
MYGNSSPVASAQTGIHEQLSALVAKHARTVFRKPVARYNRDAFEASMSAWRTAGQPPLILDAGCGVGLSTLNLAARFPDHFVIGVDQSADRIARNTAWDGTPPPNQVRVRADLVDYWRLLHEAGIRLARHYLLYPNPWPKIGHLSRRWHGHPVFPVVAALGGSFECRSNWRIYVEECAAALSQLSGIDVPVESWEALPAITPFEQKYRASGHRLWRCSAVLPPASITP